MGGGAMSEYRASLDQIGARFNYPGKGGGAGPTPRSQSLRQAESLILQAIFISWPNRGRRENGPRPPAPLQ
jgi:hypothetical protein